MRQDNANTKADFAMFFIVIFLFEIGMSELHYCRNVAEEKTDVKSYRKKTAILILEIYGNFARAY